ncbi:hypothetical protein D0839_15395, partial [Bordetella avium]|uniref:hypothetical protein n=1 Tax=Bordetella avium TaxID=521 RepID=UPI000EEE8D1D
AKRERNSDPKFTFADPSCVYQSEYLALYTAPQASPAADARDALAWGVIENARAAMDASFESGDESLGVSVPSHLAAALCLALDEFDAIAAQQGEGGE